MIVVKYNKSYKSDIMSLIKEFYEEKLKGHSEGFDEATVTASIEKFSDNTFLLIDDRECIGFLGGSAIPPLFNTNNIFHIAAWYVKSEHRPKGMFLLKQVIEALKETGYTHILATVLYTDKNREQEVKTYKHMNFIRLETHYLRRI